MSDVHLEFLRDVDYEFWDRFSDLGQADVCVVAGDTVPWLKGWKAGVDFLSRLRDKYPEVILVLGNHDYYGSTPRETEEAIETLKYLLTNVLWAKERSVVINGQRFLGDTLWFRDDHKVDFSGASTKDWMTDFRAIREFEPWVYNRNREMRHFLEEHLAPTDIVVTHHMPSYRCVSMEFQGSDMNRYFVCPMDELILERKPKLWIHGHTHSPIDLKIGETRVYANPKGYPGEGANQRFYDRLAIEV